MNDPNTKILRKVGDAEAFYFYRALGDFTGQKANSLEELLQKVKEIAAESLEFHLSREDFEKWIVLTLGDARLAKDVKTLRAQKATTGNDLRERLSLLISKRLKELKSASPVQEAKKQTKKKTSI